MAVTIWNLTLPLSDTSLSLADSSAIRELELVFSLSSRKNAVLSKTGLLSFVSLTVIVSCVVVCRDGVPVSLAVNVSSNSEVVSLSVGTEVVCISPLVTPIEKWPSELPPKRGVKYTYTHLWLYFHTSYREYYVAVDSFILICRGHKRHNLCHLCAL